MEKNSGGLYGCSGGLYAEYSVLVATLATAQAELSLSWGGAKVDQQSSQVPGKGVGSGKKYTKKIFVCYLGPFLPLPPWGIGLISPVPL